MQVSSCTSDRVQNRLRETPATPSTPRGPSRLYPHLGFRSRILHSNGQLSSIDCWPKADSQTTRVAIDERLDTCPSTTHTHTQTRYYGRPSGGTAARASDQSATWSIPRQRETVRHTRRIPHGSPQSTFLSCLAPLTPPPIPVLQSRVPAQVHLNPASSVDCRGSTDNSPTSQYSRFQDVTRLHSAQHPSSIPSDLPHHHWLWTSPSPLSFSLSLSLSLGWSWLTEQPRLIWY